MLYLMHTIIQFIIYYYICMCIYIYIYIYIFFSRGISPLRNTASPHGQIVMNPQAKNL